MPHPVRGHCVSMSFSVSEVMKLIVQSVFSRQEYWKNYKRPVEDHGAGSLYMRVGAISL